jgi:hypothetical protein
MYTKAKDVLSSSSKPRYLVHQRFQVKELQQPVRLDGR